MNKPSSTPSSFPERLEGELGSRPPKTYEGAMNMLSFLQDYGDEARTLLQTIQRAEGQSNAFLFNRTALLNEVSDHDERYDGTRLPKKTRTLARNMFRRLLRTANIMDVPEEQGEIETEHMAA